MAAVAQLDRDLVRRVQSGDKSAFDSLVRKYQQKIGQLVSRYIKDPSEALDVAQDAFIKAYRALPNFRGESAFYTWMYRIAVNTAKNHIAMRARHSSEEEIDVEEAEQFESAGLLRDNDTPEGLMLGDELIAVIQRGLNELPDELRIALSLREFRGCSYDEIATIMNCPVGTVRSRIFRARDAIDKRLAYLYE